MEASICSKHAPLKSVSCECCEAAQQVELLISKLWWRVRWRLRGIGLIWPALSVGPTLSVSQRDSPFTRRCGLAASIKTFAHQR